MPAFFFPREERTVRQARPLASQVGAWLRTSRAQCLVSHSIADGSSPACLRRDGTSPRTKNAAPLLPPGPTAEASMPHVSLACRHHAGTRPDRSAGRTALQLRQPEAETRLELVYDTEPPHPAGTMAFFRHSTQASELPPGIDTRGLESLQLSGSERITSVEQVRAIRQACGDAPLVVVDLRQESHAVADGHSLTWRGPMDWGNVGLGTAAATAREAEQLEELRRQGNAVATHADHVKGKSDEPAPPAPGHDPCPFGAGDRGKPRAPTIAVSPSRTICARPAGRWTSSSTWYAACPMARACMCTCNGGRGRTTTFMVLYDMPRNARGGRCGRHHGPAVQTGHGLQPLRIPPP